MTQHTFEPGDRCVTAHSKRYGTILPKPPFLPNGFEWVRLDDGSEQRFWPPGLSPVRVTADHIGKWARITDQDSAVGYRGHRGVVEALSIGAGIRSDDGRYRTADPGCAVLVAGPADDPAPQAQPEEDAAGRWRISGLTDVLVRDEQGEVVLMARTPEHAARAVAAVNEANGLREEVKRLQDMLVASDNRTCDARDEADALRAELVEVQDVAERANGKRIQAEAERDRLAAQLTETQDTNRGLDLPDVEVHRDERGLYVDMGGSMKATLPNTESTEFSAVRAAAVLALHRARLVEERGAAQEDTPDEDNVDADVALVCRSVQEHGFGSIEAANAFDRIAAAARRAGQEDKR